MFSSFSAVCKATASLSVGGTTEVVPFPWWGESRFFRKLWEGAHFPFNRRQVCQRQTTTTAAKALTHWISLRGPKGPLFQVGLDIFEGSRGLRAEIFGLRSDA